MRLAPGVAVAVLALSLPRGAAAAAGEAEALRRHVEYLASEALEGRLSGTPGARAAADYIAAALERLGARPLPGRSDIRFDFEFSAGSRDIGSRLELGERTWSTPETVQALAFSDAARVSGAVVFAGYGITVPDGGGVAYDSYAGLDVEGKVVLVLRYAPEQADRDTRAALLRYAGLRYKALAARERGAKALLVVTGPSSPHAGETVPMSFDTAIAGSGITAASIGGEVAEALLAPSGHDLKSAQAALDTANPHVAGFDLGVDATLDVRLERERRTGTDVVAVLPGTGGGEDAPWVLLGAHYDHLGHGDGSSSLAREGEAGRVHPGADDNASGVAAVLEAAARLAGHPTRQPIAVCFWSGEELGLLGSTAFVRDGVLAPDRIAAYLNLDMVGRVRENHLAVQAVASSPDWPALVEAANRDVGFDLELQDDPYLPTDSTAFNEASVPTLSLFSGAHEDYHRPTDLPATLDYADLARVVDLTVRLAGAVAERETAPTFARVERTRPTGGGRDTLRAYTGTIPDYTSDVPGLRLSGVREGGPAAEAGLQAGDVIVEMGGQTIANIYDYTYALDAVKIDEPVEIVYLRDGERRTANLVPRARP